MDISKNSTGSGKDFFLIKGGNGRYLVEYKKQGDAYLAKIVGIADRGNLQNMKKLEKAMLELYGVNLQY
ncbi:MAG TPA: hypothetical protein V6C58_14630 [Allocoleopsis sp.]